MDTTKAELNADRAAMFKDNRVYAVMSPQVFEMIEASVVASQVTVLQGNETTLQSEVASFVGLPGYRTPRVTTTTTSRVFPTGQPRF